MATKRSFLTDGTDEIARRIVVVRAHKVMIDSDLAQLYGVSTKRLNEQVRRNSDRFEGFRFQLTAEERAEVVANCDHLASSNFHRLCPTLSPSTAR
jgi:hypothetical protein